jgi:hypothetical protein
MYVGVRALGPSLPVDVMAPALRLARSLVQCVSIGVPVYVGSVVLLWLASGRPDMTAESWILARARTILNRRSLAPLI